MKIAELFYTRNHTSEPLGRRDRVGFTKPTALYMVTSSETGQLGTLLSRGMVPCDFAAKLRRMAGQDIGQQFIEQNCRLFIALLKASQEGSFQEASPAELDRLLKVLAYVRKDDDLIPDYRHDGFVDDQQEVRAVASELAPVLHTFKSWRLRHQVPGMWLRSEALEPKSVVASL